MPIRRDSRNGKWLFRSTLRLPDGRRERIYGQPTWFGLPDTKVGAQEAERREIARILAGGVVRPQPVKELEPEIPTVKDFSDHFMKVSKVANKPASVDSKETVLRLHINPKIGHLRLDQVTYAEIEDLKLHARDKLGAKSTNNVLTVLRRMLAIAKKRGVIASIPEIEWLKVPKSKFDFLTFAEAERLIAAAEGEWTTMILLGVRTGMRLGELMALRWEDVDLVAGRLMVRQAVSRGIIGTPKSGKDRELPLSPETVRALKSHRHLRGPYVFCDQGGDILTKGETKHPLWRACKRAELRRIGWHVLRHTFASHLAMRGVALKAIQELGGWATLSMVMRYAHLTPEVKRDAVALLDMKSVAPRGTDAEKCAK